jgi:hypothetical protein
LGLGEPRRHGGGRGAGVDRLPYCGAVWSRRHLGLPYAFDTTIALPTDPGCVRRRTRPRDDVDPAAPRTIGGPARLNALYRILESVRQKGDASIVSQEEIPTLACPTQFVGARPPTNPTLSSIQIRRLWSPTS